MLTGALVAVGIIVVSLLTVPIPIVHLVTVIPGPFVGGFIGGGIANADEGRIISFGLLVAGLMLVPAAVMILLGFLLDVEGIVQTLLIVVGAAIVPYAWWAATIGALISYLLRRKSRAQQEVSSESATGL